jgi:hypothetical protein
MSRCTELRQYQSKLTTCIITADGDPNSAEEFQALSAAKHAHDISPAMPLAPTFCIAAPQDASEATPVGLPSHATRTHHSLGLSPTPSPTHPPVDEVGLPQLIGQGAQLTVRGQAATTWGSTRTAQQHRKIIKTGSLTIHCHDDSLQSISNEVASM